MSIPEKLTFGQTYVVQSDGPIKITQTGAHGTLVKVNVTDAAGTNGREVVFTAIDTAATVEVDEGTNWSCVPGFNRGAASVQGGPAELPTDQKTFLQWVTDGKLFFDADGRLKIATSVDATGTFNHDGYASNYTKTVDGAKYTTTVNATEVIVKKSVAGVETVLMHLNDGVLELGGARVATVADDYGAMLSSQVNSGFSDATTLPVTAWWDGLIEHTGAARGLLYLPDVGLPSDYSSLTSNLGSVPWAGIAGTNSVSLSSQSLTHVTFVLGRTNRGQANYTINCPAAIVHITQAKEDARTGIACFDRMNAKKIVFSVPRVTSLWVSSYTRPRFCWLRQTGDVSGVTLYVNAPVLARLGDASSSGSTANENEFTLVSTSTGYPHIYLNMPNLGQSMHLFLAENASSSRTLYFRKEELLYLFTHIKRTPDADGAEIKIGVDSSLYDATSGTWLDADLDAAAAALETPATTGANVWTLNIVTNA